LEALVKDNTRDIFQVRVLALELVPDLGFDSFVELVLEFEEVASCSLSLIALTVDLAITEQ
jgi:hypothetical protein